MEYSHLLKLADECEDPYMRLVYAGKNLVQLQTHTHTLAYISHMLFNYPLSLVHHAHHFLSAHMHIPQDGTSGWIDPLKIFFCF